MPANIIFYEQQSGTSLKSFKKEEEKKWNVGLQPQAVYRLELWVYLPVWVIESCILFIFRHFV